MDLDFLIKKNILYHTDPSGTMIEFLAKGIGSADDGINNILIENYKKVIFIIDK